MFILYAIPVGILAGLALGGRVAGLATIQFKWAWVIMLGLAVQLVLFSDFVTERIGEAGVPIYVLSTLAVAGAVAANLRIRGMPIVLVGAASNLAAILANGGYMPTSPAALEALGHTFPDGYSNSSYDPDPALPWLTDIFAMPAWLPAANVFSIGDVLIGLGVVVVITFAMRSPVAPRTPNVASGVHDNAPTAPNSPAGDPAAPDSATA